MGLQIAIIGRTETLYETALLLIKNGHDIALIITAKEAPEYTKTAQDFKLLAENLDIPFKHAPRIEEAIELIKSIQKIDIGVSVNYTGIIPQHVIDLIPLGILNAHGGDLPRYRGNACAAWAIINGETRIGLSIHKMVGGELDSGNILEKEYFELTQNTKITEVNSWINARTPHLFVESIAKLEIDPSYVLEKQSKNFNDIIRCYPRNPDDGLIHWHKSSLDILRLINASNKPYAGAFCYLDGIKLIIWEAELFKDNEIYLSEVGQVSAINIDGSIIVITGNGKLKISLIEYGQYIGWPKQVIKSIRKRLL